MVKKRKEIRCNAASLPGPGQTPPNVPPQRSFQIAKASAIAAGKTVLPGIIGFSTGYGSHLVADVVPKFHRRLMTEGLKPAVLFAVESFLHGQSHEPETNMNLTFFNFARGTLKMMSPKQRQLAFQDFEQQYGPEELKLLKSKLGLRGGGRTTIESNDAYRKIYIAYLFYSFFIVFLPTFFKLLDQEIQKNPEVEKEFYLFYFSYVVPVGYNVNKKNCRLTCSMVTDEVFLGNLELE